LIFDVAKIIEFCSQGTTIYAGTVILTGTPSGVGMAMKPPSFLKHGDEVDITIEKIGTLHNQFQYA
jgi:2-keto-4-pentenoate hydratase/2-oxohepta-3-ene-1,7-dioic acid hydratase in catechol pathway